MSNVELWQPSHSQSESSLPLGSHPIHFINGAVYQICQFIDTYISLSLLAFSREAMTIFDQRCLPAIALAQARRGGPLDKSLCPSAWVCG